MVENYTKDLKESVYHGAVVSALAHPAIDFSAIRTSLFCFFRPAKDSLITLLARSYFSVLTGPPPDYE